LQIAIDVELALPTSAFQPGAHLQTAANRLPTNCAQMSTSGKIHETLTNLPPILFDFEFITIDGVVACPRYLLYAFSLSLRRRMDEVSDSEVKGTSA
jgi:hypothetical protein